MKDDYNENEDSHVCSCHQKLLFNCRREDLGLHDFKSCLSDWMYCHSFHLSSVSIRPWRSWQRASSLAGFLRIPLDKSELIGASFIFSLVKPGSLQHHCWRWLMGQVYDPC